MKKPNNKKQELGIYYTPEAVVEFIFDILNILKNKEDREIHRWQTHKPQHYPTVIDPACGEGIFLKKAIEKNFTKSDWVFGLDINAEVVKKWPKISLLTLFNNDSSKLKAHFFHQNGLDKIQWEQHKKEYDGKLKQGDIKNEQFDAVVGNPPYGGVGIGTMSSKLESSLFNFKLWKSFVRKRGTQHVDRPGLFGNKIEEKEKKRLQKFPIEILFIDRFIQLAKPGGSIAIIIPDGILANSTYNYVREFIAKRTKILVVVSLPRETFKQVGTTAKTSILFLQKNKDEKLTSLKNWDYPVFLVSVSKIEKELFDIMVKEFESFTKTGELIMDKNSKNPKIIRWTDGKEAIMVRGDKTAKEMYEEKPSGRIDADYWHPKYTETLEDIAANFKIKELNQVLETPIIAPDHVRASKGEAIGKQFECEYRTLKDLLFTGLNYADINYCSDNAYKRLQRTKLDRGDILFAGSGVGAVGRLGIVERVSERSCVGDLFILRNPNINNYYLYIYLLTIYGQSQIERIFHGVQSAKISVPEIGKIRIMIIHESVQDAVERKYLKMFKFHDKAMEAKKRADEKGYKENLGTAEKMLKDLIAKTEAVIRGERKDVI